MKEININELYSYFCSAISHCGTFLLRCNDDDIGYHIFEEFDTDCNSFLSDLALKTLLTANYISKEIHDSALNLAKLFRALDDTHLWNVDAVRNSEEWLRVLSLGDDINKAINNHLKSFAVYFSEDSDLVELETSMKEWRGDVLVSCDGCLYLLDFITINRLNKEYELARNDSRTYKLTNTVVVENVKRDTIINEAIKLVAGNLIKAFATIDLKQFYCNTFPELQDICNWKRVY